MHYLNKYEVVVPMTHDKIYTMLCDTIKAEQKNPFRLTVNKILWIGINKPFSDGISISSATVQHNITNVKVQIYSLEPITMPERRI